MRNIYILSFLSLFLIFIITEEYRSTLLVVQLVEALRYKPEDRGFDSRCCH
jgi:hypothetical protein